MRIIDMGQEFLGYYSKDRIGMLSAAFGYVTIFSIGPLVLVFISIVGLVLGQHAVSGKLYADLASAFGSDAAHTVQNAVAHTQHFHDNVIGLIVGIVGVAIGAIALTGQLQNSFNAIFDVGPDPKAGLKRTVYVKLKNVMLVLIAGLAITASIVASTLVVALGTRTQSWLGTSGVLLEVFNSLGFWIIFTLIIYGLYRTLPDIAIPGKIALVAAITVSILFLIGRFVLGLIIGHNGTVSAYGAAASFVSLMLWAYYSGQILLIGAEGIKFYADKHALTLKPKRFNIRRKTVQVDADSVAGKFIETWQRGQEKLHRK